MEGGSRAVGRHGSCSSVEFGAMATCSVKTLVLLLPEEGLLLNDPPSS